MQAYLLNCFLKSACAAHFLPAKFDPVDPIVRQILNQIASPNHQHVLTVSSLDSNNATTDSNFSHHRVDLRTACAHFQLDSFR